MNFKIAHHTTYVYSAPAAVCQNQVILTPRESSRVRCHSPRLSIRPTPTTSSRRIDSFGNHVHAFSVEEKHRQLSISSTCRVAVFPQDPLDPRQSPAWELLAESVASQQDPGWFDAWLFRCDSPRVTRNDQFADYAMESFTPHCPVLESLLDLTSRIRNDFAYDTQATDVNTSTHEAFKLRKGVCQDFAHVQIACLRSIGIPARYVSGYLRTLPPPGKERLVGADQSHAWVSAYCGPVGWVEVDPTNDTIVTTDHVTVAYGRDYTDVAPIRGVFLGGGAHQLTVSVDVEPLDE